jgi:hypothetical protein
MRVFAGLILCATSAALAVAASAMPPAEDMLGNTTALKDSPSIAGRPDAVAAEAPAGPDLSEGHPELVAIMDQIEKSQRMPLGSAPVASYTRYYAWADAAKTKVTAIYLKSATPERRWVSFDDLPETMGQSCSVIELIFDVKSGVLDGSCINGG